MNGSGMKWVAFLFTLTLGMNQRAVFAQNREPAPTEKNWPEAFYEETLARPNDSPFKFTNALFDGGDDLRFFQNDFDPNNGAPLQINRDVYRNFDLLNTITVFDRIKFFYAQGLFGFGWDTSNGKTITLSPFPFVDVNLGAKGSLEIRDIRQMGSEDVKKIAKTEPDDPNQDLKEVNPYLATSKLGFLDPEKIPFKLPLSRKDVHKLHDGELVSYNITGQVGFDGSVGLKVLPTEIMSAGVSVLIETYIIGEFEVAIQKEDDRFAKVRISRIHGREASAQLQAGLAFNHFLKGFFIFKGSVLSTLGDQVAENILPFQLEAMTEKDTEISVAYRYDLNSDEGKDSFHHAVLGSFKESERTAEHDAKLEWPAVTKIFDRTSHQQDTGHAATFDLSFLFDAQHSQKTETSTTEIKSADGTSHLLLGMREDLHQTHSFSGNAEKTERKFSLLINQDTFSQHQEDSLILSFENTIEDAKTNGAEMNAYAGELQKTLHEPNIFPVFPLSSIDPKHPGKTKRANYGKSTFYFGYSTHLNGLAQFLSRDPNEVSQEAESLGVHVNPKTFLRARAALEKTDSVKLLAALNELFGNRKQLPAFTELFFSHLAEHDFEKFKFAQNASFGSIQTRSHHGSAAESLLQSTSASLTSTPDVNASVDHLLASVDARQKTTLSFELSTEPEFLLFKIAPALEAKHTHRTVELILYNRDHRFHAGRNQIVLDPNSTDPLEQKLSANLKPGETVNATLGFKQKNKNWGDGLTVQFALGAVN